MTVGNRIDVFACGGKVVALPHSLNILATNVAAAAASSGGGATTMSDPRTPRKLFKTSTSSSSGGLHSWLAPLSRCMTDDERSRSGHTQNQAFSTSSTSYSNFNPRYPTDNTVYIMFPYPVTLGYIRIFNYSKTLARGVKEFSLYADEKLVFMGTLKSGMSAIYLIIFYIVCRYNYKNNLIFIYS